MKNNPFPLIFAILSVGQACSQEVTATATALPVSTPVFQVLSVSTVQQQDGSSVTFRQVIPPAFAPQQVQPAASAASAAAPRLAAAGGEALSQTQEQEPKMLSISASVQANGFTVLRWTCGTSQRMQAVSNVDFRTLAGLGSLETPQAGYFIILSAGPTDEALSDAEAQAAQSLPVAGPPSFALLSSSVATNPADEAALDAMEALLEYYAAHRAELVQQYAQREAETAARALAERNAPPPPPRHSIVHFWPLQQAQRTAIQAQVQQEAQQGMKGGAQP